MDTGMVEVHLYAAARAAVGASVLQARPAPLSVILDSIEAAHPEFASVRTRCSFLIDGTSAHQEVPVGAGSRVDVLPPFAGG